MLLQIGVSLYSLLVSVQRKVSGHSTYLAQKQVCNSTAKLDTAEYPTGIKIPDKQMKALETDGPLDRHHWHGEWNHTLHPEPDTPEPD